MITDTASWVALMDGLIAATRDGRLEWSEKDTKRAKSAADAIGAQFSMSKPKVFTASTSAASYELSSVDAFGTDPYSLEVWGFKGTRLKPLGSLSSSATLADRFILNEKLRALFIAVDETTESSSDIVARLLGDL